MDAERLHDLFENARQIRERARRLIAQSHQLCPGSGEVHNLETRPARTGKESGETHGTFPGKTQTPFLDRINPCIRNLLFDLVRWRVLPPYSGHATRG